MAEFLPLVAICLVILLTLNCLGVRGYRHMTGIKLRSITVTLLVCFMLSAISADGDWCLSNSHILTSVFGVNDWERNSSCAIYLYIAKRRTTMRPYR